jgi:hypothetical protein
VFIQPGSQTGHIKIGGQTHILIEGTVNL